MTFQPFVVNCLTCGSALRVTDPAIVGTIASCPQCHSMVQIDAQEGSAPPPQMAVGQSSIDSEAITEDAIASADSVAVLNPAAQDAIEPIADSGQQPFAGQPPNPVDGNRTVPPDQVWQADQVWQSPRTAQTRQIALIAALSITGLLIAAAVFGWFVSTWRATNSSDTAAISEIDATSDRNVNDPSDPPNESIASSTTDDSASIKAELTDPADEAPLSSDNPATVTSEPDKETVASVAPQSTSQVESPALVPDGLIPSSPLETIAESGSLPSEPDTDPTAAIEEPQGMQELPPELAKFTQVLPRNGSQQKPNLTAPPTIDEIELDAAASEDEFELSQTRPRELNLRGDLGIRMALASDGYRLADLLLVCGQVTTVPMEIDWVTSDLVGLAVANNVDVPTGWKTAREMIDSIAAALQCRWEERQTLLVLTPKDERFDTAIANISNLEDFGVETESAVATLTMLLNPESDTPPRQLQIGPSRQAQQTAALAIDSLRRMRGIEPKIPDAYLHRWAMPDSQPAEWPLLVGGKIGPQVDTPITIAELLRDTSRRNEAVCLVNWHDLNRRGLGPETLLLPLMEADAAKTMQRAFGRWNIQVRQVDPQHWWIGSQATYDKLPVVVWTVELGERRAQVVERIEVIIAGNPDEDIRFAHDSVSDRLLIKMPRYIARQLPKIVN